MKKRVLVALGIVCLVTLAGLGVFGYGYLADSKEYQRIRYEGYDEIPIYVNDAPVRENGALSRAQYQVRQTVLEYDLRPLTSVYRHRWSITDGMDHSIKGLLAEMDARLWVIFAKHPDTDFRNNRFYATFEEIDVRGEAAKVVVHYRIAPPERWAKAMAEETDVVFLKHSERGWAYVNIISTEGNTDPAFFEKVRTNDNPKDWLTTYSYDNCKRSDYAGLDYRAYIDENGNVDLNRPAKKKQEVVEMPPAIDKAALATTIADHRQEDGSFAIMGTEATHERFAPDKLPVTVKQKRLPALVARVHADSNQAQIRRLIEASNRTYLSSLYSGVYRVIPRECFASDGIYKEANARTLVEMFEGDPYRGVNVQLDGIELDMREVRIEGKMAKVVLSRSVKCSYAGTEEPLTETYLEGYVLQKIDGRWTIENIIFTTKGFHPTMKDFMEPANDAEAWRNLYGFEALRRKEYQPGRKNYSDDIKGEVTAPIYDPKPEATA